MPNHLVQIRLSKDQIRKLKRMMPVQVKSADIANPAGIAINLDEAKVRKLARAKKQGKGARLQLSREEVEGSGFLDVVKSVYRGAKTVAKDLYQNRNEIKDGLVSTLNMAKELKALVKELKGEGMSESDIRDSLMDLGYSKKELEGAGLFDAIKKPFKQLRKGLKEVNKVARYIPVVGEVTGEADKIFDIANAGIDLVDKHHKRPRRGRGSTGSRSVSGCGCACNCGNPVAPAPRHEGQRSANVKYADFYDIVMQQPPRSASGQGLRMSGQGLTLP